MLHLLYSQNSNKSNTSPVVEAVNKPEAAKIESLVTAVESVVIETKPVAPVEEKKAEEPSVLVEKSVPPSVAPIKGAY